MKIFCIGFNKTGTTSLESLLDTNGLRAAPQPIFERNILTYFNQTPEAYINLIKHFSKSYQFYQDIPFSLPNFYKILDKEFPNSKFILTIRDNEDEWYDSLIRFYKQSFPSFTSPQQIEYILPGVIYKILTECWGGTKEDPYNKKQLTQSYLNHIKDVKTYFKDREDDLLIVNLKDKDLTLKLENFIGVKFANKKIPHLNRTK